jgi:Icc-related predicted phosphoesterase
MGLGRILRPGRGQAGDARHRLYYAADIHGTESLWRKFLVAPRYYRADVLIMGGDVTGKVVIPVVEDGDGFVATRFGRQERARTEDELAVLERRIRDNGMYPYRTTSDEVERIAGLTIAEQEEYFEPVMRETFDRWLDVADERLRDTDALCYVMAGNDDPPLIEDEIRNAKHVLPCDEAIVEFGSYTMISVGHSNRTPWHTRRELGEDELYRRISALADQVTDFSRCIFNLHVPPYDSQLDIAAELDGEFNQVRAGGEPKLTPVGSTAVREAIERYQPLLSVHGHIHESPGAVRIGRTLCINPGSEYHTGRIQGCLIDLRGERITHQFVTG